MEKVEIDISLSDKGWITAKDIADLEQQIAVIKNAMKPDEQIVVTYAARVFTMCTIPDIATTSADIR
jgi:hypothetical protein